MSSGEDGDDENVDVDIDDNNESSTDPLDAENTDSSVAPSKVPREIKIILNSEEVTPQNSIEETEAEVEKALEIVKAMTLETGDSSGSVENMADIFVDNTVQTDSNGNALGSGSAFSPVDNDKKKPVPAERTSLAKGKGSPSTIKRTYVDDAPTNYSMPGTTSLVALPDKTRNDPQLMTIRKRDSHVPFANVSFNTVAGKFILPSLK